MEETIQAFSNVCKWCNTIKYSIATKTGTFFICRKCDMNHNTVIPNLNT